MLVGLPNMDKEKIEEKIGEAIYLEMAAHKAVEQLASKGLIPNQGSIKLEGMRKEAITIRPRWRIWLESYPSPRRFRR